MKRVYGTHDPARAKRVPPCARLDRVRLRVLSGSRGFSAINRARAICVRVPGRVCARVCALHLGASGVCPRGGRDSGKC